MGLYVPLELLRSSRVLRSLKRKSKSKRPPYMVREAAEGVVLTLPLEDVGADIGDTPLLRIFADRQPDRTNGLAQYATLRSSHRTKAANPQLLASRLFQMVGTAFGTAWTTATMLKF